MCFCAWIYIHKPIYFYPPLSLTFTFCIMHCVCRLLFTYKISGTHSFFLILVLWHCRFLVLAVLTRTPPLSSPAQHPLLMLSSVYIYVKIIFFLLSFPSSGEVTQYFLHCPQKFLFLISQGLKEVITAWFPGRICPLVTRGC